MKAYVVDSAAVRSNLQLLQTRAGSAVLWAVLKGDGYGLGLLPMAAICREAGVTHFAVTEVSEVSRLRAGGFGSTRELDKVLKDIDLKKGPRHAFRLSPSRRALLVHAIEDDSKFLEQHHIMDYSMLIGVKRRGLSEEEELRREYEELTKQTGFCAWRVCSTKRG